MYVLRMIHPFVLTYKLKDRYFFGKSKNYMKMHVYDAGKFIYHHLKALGYICRDHQYGQLTLQMAIMDVSLMTCPFKRACSSIHPPPLYIYCTYTAFSSP